MSLIFRNTGAVFLVLIVLGAFFVQSAAASDAVVAYRSNTGSGTNLPKLKFWNSSGNGSWGSEIELPNANSSIQLLMLRSYPALGKLVLVTESNDALLDAYVCTSNCTASASWVVTHDIANVSEAGTNPNERRFDVAFETSTGNALVVYAVSSTNTSRDLGYKILPAGTSNFSGITEQYINDATQSANIAYTWVSLDAKPTAGSNEMALTGFDDSNNTINAWVWNGSSWGNQVTVSSSATATNSDEALAVRYAADGSKAMVIGGNGTAGNIDYVYWNGASWSAVGTFDITSNTNDVQWLRLKADPSSVGLQAVAVTSGTDLYTAYWNGASWNASNRLESALDSDTARPADFEWLSSGNTGRLTWDADAGGSTVNQMTCSPNCVNGSDTTISSYSGTGAWLSLYRNPTTTDNVQILALRMNSTPALGSFRFNGTNYTNYGDANITANAATSTPLREAYSLAFLANATITGNCPVVNSSMAMSQDFTGAPNSVSPPALACIDIEGSNLVFDCNGHSIYNNATAGYTYGIYINGSQTNVTIQNCAGIHDYYGGIWAAQLAYGTISNSVVYNNTDSCIYVGSGNNLTGNTVYNCTYGFNENGQFGDTFTGNTARNNTYGFYILSSSSGTLTSNVAYNNSYDGFYISVGSNCVLQNNVAYNNSNDGFELSIGSNCAFTNNTASNNSYDGFELRYMTGTNITNNTASNNNIDGVDCGFCHDNALIGNKAYNHAYVGFYYAGTNNYNNSLVNNTAYNNQYGIYPYYSYNSILVNNTAYNNTYGIILSYGSGNNVTSNTARNNTYGFYIRDGSSNNTFTGNTAYNDTSDGFYFQSGTSNNTLTGNTAYNNGVHGFILDTSPNNTLATNTAYRNSWAGFYLVASADNNLSGNTAYNNTWYGFDLITSSGNTLSGNTAYNNTYYGIDMENGGNMFWNTALYNNRYDLNVGGSVSGFTYSMTNTTFRNPSGTLANYTALSISDSVATGDEYFINWSGQPAAPPSDRMSFAQKFVNITTVGGTPSIDSIKWNWLDSELVGYVKNYFELWKYNGSWTNMSGTLDTSANTMTLNNLVPGSTYGLLQFIVPNCPIVSSDYTMAYDFSGAPNNASEIGAGTMACVKINGSNLVFDCAGHSITNNGTGVGILLNGSNVNVTVKNCNVYNYSDGYYLKTTSNSVLTDDVGGYNSNAFYLDGSSFNSLARVTATGNHDGLEIWSSNNNTVTDSVLSGPVTADDMIGFGGYGNVFRNIAISALGDAAHDGAIYAAGAYNTTLDNITISQCGTDGIFFTGSSADNVVMNSNILGTRYGVDFRSGSARNSLSNNAIYGASMGVIFNASSGTMAGNTIYGNAGQGIYLYNSYVNMSGDRLFNNGQDLNVTYTGPGYSLNATGIIFDNPAGNMQSYTTLSLVDPPPPPGSYAITWAAAPALPENYTSFAQKFVNMTSSGTVSLDSITWQWGDGETAGYDETLFSLWESNGTNWTLLNATPDAASNALGLTGLTPGSVFGILYNGTYVPPTPPISGGGGGEAVKHFAISATQVCPGNKIDVYVYTSSGELTGANVREVLSDPYEGLISQDATDATGHAVFDAATEGTYTFSATKTGYANPGTVDLQFTYCFGEAPPPAQNVTPLQPPKGGANVTPPTNVTQPPPSNQTMGQAQQAISDAQSAISDAGAAGKDASGARSKLAEAQSAFDAGNYQQALELADQAKQLALNAAAPPKPPTAPTAPTTVKPTAQPSAAKGFDWMPLIILVVLGIVVVAVGAGAYLMFGQKKGNKK